MSDFNFNFIIKTIPPQSDDWEDMLKSKKIKDNGLVKALMRIGNAGRTNTTRRSGCW